MNFKLRSHQRSVRDAVRAYIDNPTLPNRLLADVTPGGGKSVLGQIAYKELSDAGVLDKVCIVSPKKNLTAQSAADFVDPFWRTGLSHNFSINEASNLVNPDRGTEGYATTYSALAADSSQINLYTFHNHRYLLVLDEAHHVAEGGRWHRALQPLVDAASYVLFMSGTMSRHDGRKIAFLPYTEASECQTG